MDGSRDTGGHAHAAVVATPTKRSVPAPPPPASLTGLAIVQRAFLYLDGPADVLRASAASHRWRELACADCVWRVKARREGILEKASVFEVALPKVGDDDASAASGDGGGGAAEEDKEEDEALGVGLAFYAQIFVLKVRMSLVI